MGGFVSGGRVSGGGLVVISLGVTVVFNIGDVTRVTVDVIVNSLAAAVGENNGVSSLGVVTIASLVLVHVDVVVVVLDGPVEFVVSGGLVCKDNMQMLLLEIRVAPFFY